MGLLVGFDDIVAANEPPGGDVYFGYINGRWGDYWAVRRRWPHLPVDSITVNADTDADWLDVEWGDATNTDAPRWVRRQQARGVARPGIYTSLANVAALLDELAKNGISRAEIRLWTAHYTPTAHICTPACGYGMPTTADGTQWRSTATFDESLLAADFNDGATPKATTGDEPMSYSLRDPETGGVWCLDPTGAIFAYDGAPYLGGANNKQMNALGFPAAGLVEYVDAHGTGYEILLDFGTVGEQSGGDRYRRYRFPRDGSAKV
jgi:hypothetical protein